MIMIFLVKKDDNFLFVKHQTRVYTLYKICLLQDTQNISASFSLLFTSTPKKHIKTIRIFHPNLETRRPSLNTEYTAQLIRQ